MTKCRAALNIKGEHFACDNDQENHWIHGNHGLEAIWASHKEVEEN